MVVLMILLEVPEAPCKVYAIRGAMSRLLRLNDASLICLFCSHLHTVLPAGLADPVTQNGLLAACANATCMFEMQKLAVSFPLRQRSLIFVSIRRPATSAS